MADARFDMPREFQVGRNVTRRTALKYLGFAGGIPIVASILAACGGNGNNSGAATQNTPASSLANTPVTGGGTPLTTFATVAPEGSPTAQAAGASPAISASPQVTAPQGKTGGTLLLASGIDPDALDPAKTIQLAADAINDSIYDRLVYIGRDRLPHPWVAEKWEISNTGTEITFSIRQGSTFHDGNPLNGTAVKFSFDRILDPATASPAKAQMGTLQRVDLVDDWTVKFTFSEAYAPFFTNISLGYGGIVSPAGVQKFGDNFGKNPVGSGPFKLKQWNSGQEIVLERFADYKNYRADGANNGPAYLDDIRFKIISEAATRFRRCRAVSFTSVTSMSIRCRRSRRATNSR